ncbi:hypothetical protein KW847_09880 [Acidovorax sp. sif0715]|nr:hypothetical protein [Acidovorax sp. sif0732]MBV7449592.1 hypothetical protein [Acidovorax sp. sif0715]
MRAPSQWPPSTPATLDWLDGRTALRHVVFLEPPG